MKKQEKKTTKKSTKNPPKKLTKKQLEALKIHDNVLLKQKKDHDAEKLAEKLAIRNKGAEYWHSLYKLQLQVSIEEESSYLYSIKFLRKRIEQLNRENGISFINGMYVCALCVTLAVVILKLWS